MITDTLALLPLVKRQVFCVGDRLKMKPTFRVSLTASQAGENTQINAPEHTNVSSILAYICYITSN